MGDDRTQQRQIVVMRARPGADPPRPLRVGQILISGHFALCHAVFRGVDDAGAAGQAEPLVARVTVLGGNIGLQDGRVDRLGHARVHHFGQARNIHGQDQIGGRPVAFRHKALDHALVDKGDVHSDAGLGGEGIDQRLDQFRLAVGIDIHLLGQGRKRGTGQCQCKGGQAKHHC